MGTFGDRGHVENMAGFVMDMGDTNSGDIFVDFYLAAQLPNDDILYYPWFTTVPTPWVRRELLPRGWDMAPQIILGMTLPELPFGSYWWHAAFCNPDTPQPLGGIVSSIDWQMID